MAAMGTDFADDITRRCRWAIRYNDRHPHPAWSAGEKLAVALVLRDDAYLTAEHYTRRQAETRLAGDIGDTNVGAWLAYVRGELEEDDA
jgi:hypothetical protein